MLAREPKRYIFDSYVGDKMANGKIGDHPLTDITIHGRIVYSERVTQLIHRILRVANDATKRALGDKLLLEYNEYQNPDVEKLEAELAELCDRLEADARERGFEN